MSCTTTIVNQKPVETVDLDVIDFSKLAKNDPSSTRRLLTAASSSGFFWLDFQHDPEFRQMLIDLPEIYRLSDLYFSQDAEKKMKDVRLDQEASQDRGYKTSDCDETFEMADDEMMGGDIALPEALDKHKQTISRFTALCNRACKIMLPILSSGLGLPGNARLEKFHTDDKPSDSGLKLIYEPSLELLSDVGDNTHTDSGTFTLLFYDQWGLKAKIPSPDGEKWAFTPPCGTCALINVANSLQRLSNGKLHSPTHRVTQPFDGAGKRYYISYFLRPDY